MKFVFNKLFSERVRQPRALTREANLGILTLTLLAVLLTLTGCVSHTRVVAKPVRIGVVEEASLDQLINLINTRYEAVKTLTATVSIQASVNAGRDEVKDYTSFRGYILIRQPGMLRVLGLVPVVQTHMFDMASDGTTFKLFIPPRNKAITGSDLVVHPSPNALENMRPELFTNALLVHSIDPDALVYRTSDTRYETNPRTKQMIEEPNYNIVIVRRGDKANRGIPDRVIHIDRSDLTPYQQDTYNNQGVIETQVSYGAYQDFGGIRFPSLIRISRPLDKYEITLTIEKLTENQPLTDDQFELKIPPGTLVQTLSQLSPKQKPSHTDRSSAERNAAERLALAP